MNFWGFIECSSCIENFEKNIFELSDSTKSTPFRAQKLDFFPFSANKEN